MVNSIFIEGNTVDRDFLLISRSLYIFETERITAAFVASATAKQEVLVSIPGSDKVLGIGIFLVAVINPGYVPG